MANEPTETTPTDPTTDTAAATESTASTAPTADHADTVEITPAPAQTTEEPAAAPAADAPAVEAIGADEQGTDAGADLNVPMVEHEGEQVVQDPETNGPAKDTEGNVVPEDAVELVPHHDDTLAVMDPPTGEPLTAESGAPILVLDSQGEPAKGDALTPSDLGEASQNQGPTSPADEAVSADPAPTADTASSASDQTAAAPAQDPATTSLPSTGETSVADDGSIGDALAQGGGADPLAPAAEAPAPTAELPAADPAGSEDKTSEEPASTELPGDLAAGLPQEGADRDGTDPANAPEATVPNAEQHAPEEHPVPAEQPSRIDPQSGVPLPADQQEQPDGGQKAPEEAGAIVGAPQVPESNPVENAPLQHPAPAEEPCRIDPLTSLPLPQEQQPEGANHPDATASQGETTAPADQPVAEPAKQDQQPGLAQEDAKGYEGAHHVRHEVEKMLQHVRGALKHEAENARKLVQEIESHLKKLLRRLKGEN